MPSIINRYLFALKNYKAAFAAAFFFGCIAPGAKFFTDTIPPQTMAGLLYFSAGLGLLITLFIKEKNFKIKFLSKLQKIDFKWLLMATCSGGILGPIFLTYGIRQISGTTASLLLNLEAVLTSVIAWVVVKEHCEKKIVYGMICILLGCLTLSLNSQASGGVDSVAGFVLICLACFSWAIDNNVTRNISHLDPVFIACFKGLLAGFTNLFLAFFLQEKMNWGVEVFQVGVLGFLGIGVSLVAFITSLGLIGTARTGAIFSTAPFIGSLISIIILREPLTLPTFIALFLMFAGLWLHISEKHSHEHVHEEFGHAHEHIHDEHHVHEHSPQDSPNEPHTHYHVHSKLTHTHEHFPDIHHQHKHNNEPEKE